MFMNRRQVKKNFGGTIEIDSLAGTREDTITRSTRDHDTLGLFVKGARALNNLTWIQFGLAFYFTVVCDGEELPKYPLFAIGLFLPKLYHIIELSSLLIGLGPFDTKMSLRTFTVFQDTPSADIAKPKAKTVTSSTLSSKPLNVNCATTLTTIEKENVDPLTGERAGPSTNGKKRKTSVLTTKMHAPLTSKKQKELTEPSDFNPDVKKRKSSASSTLKPKTGGKKDGKTSSLRKTKKPLRRVSPMPKVDEEAEAERVRGRITQADIDSRCYELTVKPLADLSQAYEQGPSLETAAIDNGVVKFRSVKESSAEPEFRDYFSPPQLATLPLGSDGTSALDSRTFSTPERKQIYAAFTFTTPSPTKERFNRTHSNSVSPPNCNITSSSPRRE
ncbi:hypothetical protein C0989_007983 [Termitomyces sp. Mn162]|nr:hypothetical protein C0989_007983 [Termitomyces sp. Mn162]